MASALSGCKGITQETYGFRAGEARVSEAASVSIQTEGTSQQIDTAGRLIDRTGGPYWLGIYIDVDDGVDIKLRKLELRGLNSGTQISPSVSPLQPMSDSSWTLFGEADAVALRHEDHIATLHFQITNSSGTKVDSVQLLLRKKYQQDHLSFWERLGRL